ncbi:hypothetical protein [Chitinophaga terrae (ex Kim and Jung 2007)]|uniref:hypothetical protein n=1 Tax=Chitinophaga terrae (ex Kim and Jung 2007) TaxID=408074 RepID=UPI000B7DC3B5|nr:hypothetical protein [Chitinophaga terrae (ex Kim and Jung 2007)]
MKLFRQILLLLVVVLALPQWHAEGISIQQSIPAFRQQHHSASAHAHIKPLRLKATLTRHKRRPVALNDYYNHDRSLIPLTTEIPYSVQAIDKVQNGYYFNPYLSIPVALRSWRGPPAAISLI